MPGSLSGLNIASSALRSFQIGMDTISHNIANVNTRGYSRQRVNYSALPSETLSWQKMMQLGTGVTIESITRARDTLVDRAAMNNFAEQGKMSTMTATLQQIEDTYLEPDNGISSALGKFFDGWSALGSNPSSSAARLQVRAAGETLSTRIRDSYRGLDNLESSTVSDIRATLTQIKDLSAQISNLDKEIIAKSASGAPPNDLLDQRGVMLDQLSGLVKIDVYNQPDGSVAVFAGNIALSRAAVSGEIPAGLDPSAGPIDQNLLSNLRSGKIVGLVESYQQIQSQKTQLDTFSDNLRSQVNTLHQSGKTLTGATGIDFFAWNGGGARNFELSTDVKTSVDNIASGTSGNSGDGGLALQMAQMRQTAIGGLGGRTFEQSFQDQMSRIASDVSFYQTQQSSEESVGAMIGNQRQQVSGVSLDEEFADMVKMQRSYQAAAKTLSVMDQSLQDLIGIIR